jgi:hypothetical protein
VPLVVRESPVGESLTPDRLQDSQPTIRICRAWRARGLAWLAGGRIVEA